jgi:uncharacterized protein YneR
MKIFMNEKTAKHIIHDLQADNGVQIRFFVRMGGCSTVQDGFSLGVIKDSPKYPAVKLELLDHTFYVEEEDEWFFDHNDLQVIVKDDEIGYEYVKSED